MFLAEHRVIMHLEVSRALKKLENLLRLFSTLQTSREMRHPEELKQTFFSFWVACAIGLDFFHALKVWHLHVLSFLSKNVKKFPKCVVSNFAELRQLLTLF